MKWNENKNKLSTCFRSSRLVVAALLTRKQNNNQIEFYVNHSYWYFYKYLQVSLLHGMGVSVSLTVCVRVTVHVIELIIFNCWGVHTLAVFCVFYSLLFLVTWLSYWNALQRNISSIWIEGNHQQLLLKFILTPRASLLTPTPTREDCKCCCFTKSKFINSVVRIPTHNTARTRFQNDLSWLGTGGGFGCIDI